jgi:hypothetical protein
MKMKMLFNYNTFTIWQQMALYYQALARSILWIAVGRINY